MAQEVSQFICDNINMPSCHPLDLNTTSYLSRSGSILGIQVDAPYTMALNLIGVLLCLRMYQNTNNMHACIGKGEVKLILLCFVLNNLLLVACINFQAVIVGASDGAYLLLAAAQLTLFGTLHFGIFASGITIDRIHGIMRMQSHVFLSAILCCFASVLLAFALIGLYINNYLVFLVVILMNTVAMLMYLSMQTKKLRKTKSDIWAYGVLGIIVVLYLFSLVPTLVGGDVVALFTERNLDAFFVFQAANTLFIMMFHKYWLNTCDFEKECLELNG